MTLCPVTSQLRKASNNSSSRQILTLIIGETCSRRSAMNRRWRSCTRLMDTSTLQSLSTTHTRLPLAVRSEDEGASDCSLPRGRPREEENRSPADPFDRSHLVFAYLPFKLPNLVAHPYLCPVAFRLSLLSFYFIFYFLSPRCLSVFSSLSPSHRCSSSSQLIPVFFPLRTLFALFCLLSTHCSLYHSLSRQLHPLRPLRRPPNNTSCLVQIVALARSLSLTSPSSIPNL